MILALCFSGAYKVQFLERELSEGTRSNGLESCGDDVSNENCDPSYADVCIASPTPDLNCGDVPYKNINFDVDDPHGFDREAEDVGYEG
jgi:hypothetical protein